MTTDSPVSLSSNWSKPPDRYGRARVRVDFEAARRHAVRLSSRFPAGATLFIQMWGKNRGSLVAQLQNDVVDSGVPISDILRKAKVLASLLKNEEFKHWIDAELKGYDNADDLPDYRKFRPVNLGTFSGPFGKMIKNFPIPVALLPNSIRKFAESALFQGGVKELQASSSQAAKKDGLRFPWPPEMVIIAREHVPMSDGSVLVEAWQPITKSQLDGILDQVRNRLLDFLLELQQIDPEVLKSEDAIRAIPGDAVQNSFQTIILGGQNIVATGTEFTQKATQEVASGDTQSLIAHLRSIGLDKDSLAELETAIEQDGDLQQNQLGESVKSWIGKMTVKALEGTWKVALEMAPRLLQDALSQYYKL